ncbi:TATA box-binding protein-associated factor RNA polymerase I subunit B-like [Lolium rigidum]|uniref:TATA box-binding protein-associated factor RNA polymerase I subunit B-like n=1 Tax=Lolium rigidum TaxID=89674 RepID=UPI001F5C9DB5|nr:TATA box-binding protein-associated factor RNA polymerase I subunit B-like [Lolium rigidum]
MDDDSGASSDHYGGASPDHYGGGGGSITIVCKMCKDKGVFSPDDDEDDGYFTCRECNYVNTSTQALVSDPGDIQRNRPFIRVPSQSTKTPKLLNADNTQRAPAARAFDEPDEPRDFVPGAADAWGGEPEEQLGIRIRQRYVQGLQAILQQQLQALVERHRAGALICGVAGTIWLRWVAASKVFGEMWARKVMTEDEAARGLKRSSNQRNPPEVKCEWADEALIRKHRRRAEFIFLRSLRTMLPVYSTLSVCFLACHVAREAILPTDIYRWAMEGKLPYVAAFTQVDKLLGTPVKHCPLNARQLFRPVRVIGAWQLEATAGSIARRIGLRLPSVNFYAIAQRYLSELSLPIERILPHACRIYEWAMPAELWLSSNPARVPTRVCVMAILILALRVQYNINGQGIWEVSIPDSVTLGRHDISASNDTNLPPPMKSDGSSTSEEFGTRELLCALADAYDKIDVAHDYSKDLHSYLKYCKDVVFPGIACSVTEKYVIEDFQEIYKERQDKNPKVHTTNGVNKRDRDGTSVSARCLPASSSGIRSIKSEMEGHGFCYMPPRKRPRSDGYLHYRRKTTAGSLTCIGHADYYMLIRSFAKLAEVDVRIMHASVLKLERRLAWIEERIDVSLDALGNPAS